MFLKNCWYVAGWRDEIDDGRLLARTVLGEPLLLYRTEAGAPVALQDRCCHRGAPLSLGRREGDCVRCLYHGLKFEPGGACVEIPGQANVPPKARVRSWPVVERARWLWVWMGDPARADPAGIPDTHWLDDPQWRSLPGTMHYDVPHLAIADNLLDFSHLPYVHPTTLGGSEQYAQERPLVERLARGVRVTRWVMNIPPPPFVTQVAGWTGPVDRWNIYDFTVPGLLVMDSGSAPAGQGAREGNRAGALQFHSCQALTPEAASSTHYFFTQPHDFALDQPAVTQAVHDIVKQAFAEDEHMISAQQRNLALDPDFEMLPLAMDSALMHYRRVYAALLADEQAKAQARPAGTP
ncbi:aromatic ring-hydroxylating dioxygenase subunit alpha [Aquabacterium sp.]|uniref:aromatic ring-hydroxylating dioxygenase subunit alpha n=1 Tax=Aquabacterium sp. TaxID=1872578 RepID=UPI002C18478C|nr:aromatic ring-hydroxylating dioxygenase subunit alpha [Aquabacterium sp.]HSW07325.1 aromatic ring-hydroxylating dioxygenase subunit alpha [Aquabacterium sp.]